MVQTNLHLPECLLMAMKSFLLLLFNVLAYAFRWPVLPSAFPKVHQQSRIACGRLGEKPPALTLFNLPNAASSIKDVIECLQSWGSNSVLGDSVVLAQNMPKGVQLLLDKIDIPILNVVAEEGSHGDVNVQVLNNDQNQAQILTVYPEHTSLLEKVLIKYLSSLHEMFGVRFMEDSTKDKQNVKRMDRKDTIDLLAAFAKKQKGDMEQMKERMKRQPTAADIAELGLADMDAQWTEAPMTAEDREEYELCRSGERPQVPVEVDFNDLIDNAADSGE